MTRTQLEEGQSILKEIDSIEQAIGTVNKLSDKNKKTGIVFGEHSDMSGISFDMYIYRDGQFSDVYPKLYEAMKATLTDHLRQLRREFDEL